MATRAGGPRRGQCFNDDVMGVIGPFDPTLMKD